MNDVPRPSAAGEGGQSLTQDRPWLGAAIVLVVTALTFAMVPGNGFVTWDDGIHTYQNPHLMPPTWSSVAHFWTAPYEKLYIPLSYTAYALLMLIARRLPAAPDPYTGAAVSPLPFHVACFVLHLVNALLVYAIARRLTRGTVASTLGALLFAVDPIQAESVAWISELRGLLSAFFCLASVLAYVRLGEKGAKPPAVWPACGTPIVLALLCKPAVIVMPILLLIVGALFQRRSLRACAAETLPLLAVCAPFAWITHWAQPIPVNSDILWYQRPFVPADALAFYTAKLFAPISLCIDYARRPRTVASNWWGYATWLLPAALAWLVWRLRRTVPALAAGALFFAVALVPVLGFLPFNFQNFSTVADRYVYLALLGPALTLAALLVGAARRWIIFAGIVVAILAMGTARQTTIWRNSMTLATSCLAVNPNATACHANYGYCLVKLGKFAQARDEFLTAIHEYADFEYLYIDLGLTFMKLHEYDDAANCFAYGVYRNPSSFGGHLDLAKAYLALRRYSDAIEEFSTAVKLNPRDPEAFVGLGDACAGAGQTADALLAYQGAVYVGAKDAQTLCKLRETAALLARERKGGTAR